MVQQESRTMNNNLKLGTLSLAVATLALSGFQRPALAGHAALEAQAKARQQQAKAAAIESHEAVKEQAKIQAAEVKAQTKVNAAQAHALRKVR
jgi:hypothetical protein